MTKFRINDTVRITHSPCRYFDMMGTVSDIAADQDHPFAVTGLEPWTLWFGPGELVLAERPVIDAPHAPGATQDTQAGKYSSDTKQDA